MSRRFMGKKYIAPFFVIILCLGLGFFFGQHTRTIYPALPLLVKEIRADSPQDKYTNPLIFVDTTKVTTPDRILENGLTRYIKNMSGSGQATSVSVYLRDLNSGHWTGVNEDAQ